MMYTDSKKGFKLGYIQPEGKLTEQDHTNLEWLKSLENFEAVTLLYSSDFNRNSLNNIDIIWIDIVSEETYNNIRDNSEFADIIRDYYDSGGKLFLSNYAAFLPEIAGIETVKPAIRTLEIRESGYGRKYGFQSYRGHPVFKELFGGTCVIDKDVDTIENRIGYFDGSSPAEGKVIGVEKTYVYIHPQNKIMIEYTGKNAKIISAGAFIDLGTTNLKDKSQKQLILNIFDYLSGSIDQAKTFWEKGFESVYPFKVEGFSLSEKVNSMISTEANSSLLLTKDRTEDCFLDLAGRRMMLIAKESGGIHEVWSYPFRILKNLETGIIIDSKVLWLNKLESSLEVRPESIKRTYQLKDNILEEITFVSIDKPGGVTQFRLEKPDNLRMIIKFNTDLRFMWPYDSGALGDIFSSVDKNTGTVHIRDESGDFYCIYGISTKSLDIMSGNSDIYLRNNNLASRGSSNEFASTGFLFELGEQNEFTAKFTFSGSNTGKVSVYECYNSLHSDPYKEYLAAVEHFRDLLKRFTVIESPDENFNSGYKWALIGTDKFFAETPGVGCGLLAGIGNSESGWGGGHEVSGRPGYAWYFGRDAAWSGFAVNNYGHFEIVKEQLKLFEKYQDISGKTYHELSTSGVVHYDAADATPMYIMLTAHYLRSSGDIEFIEDIWPSIKKAIDYIYSTDFNGDGLIENFRVGHGWIEGGPLYPPLTTLYLAGLWAQTLCEISYMSEILGKSNLSRKYNEDHDEVKRIIHEKFWNEDSEFYNFSLNIDGTTEPEKTVMPAVLMDFKLLPYRDVQNILNEFAGSRFSADWGIRILRNDSKHYNPVSYHSGTVWPLYTGWTALAEYNYGRSQTAFRHVMNNLNVYKDWTLGYVEEVLHGDIYMKHGVCPHQCWSETNILYPLISGMLGYEPDAPRGKARISPRLPADWDFTVINNLWIGESSFSFEMQRKKRKIEYIFQLNKGENVNIELFPEILLGMKVKKVKINGKNIGSLKRCDTGLSERPVEFLLSKRSVISFDYSGGIAVTTENIHPSPGDKTKEIKVIDYRITDNTLIIDVECCMAGNNEIIVLFNNSEIIEISGAVITNRDRKKYTLKIASDTQVYSKKQVKLNLNSC